MVQVQGVAFGFGVGLGVVDSVHPVLFHVFFWWAVALQAVSLRSRIAWALGGTVWISSIWSVDPGDTERFALTIWSVATIASQVKGRDVAVGFAAAMPAWFVSVFTTVEENGRARLLAQHALMASEVMFVAFIAAGERAGRFGWVLITLAAFPAALAASRSPIGAMWLYSLAKRSNLVLYGATVTIVLFGLFGADRLSNIGQDLHDRVETSAGDTGTAFIRAASPRNENEVFRGDRRLTWFGYGFGAYNVATGIQRPHSVYSLLAYELGILALLPAGVLVFYLTRRALSWPVVLSVLGLGLFSDDLVATPEGLFLLALTVAIARDRHAKRDHHRSDTQRPAASVTGGGR